MEGGRLDVVVNCALIIVLPFAWPRAVKRHWATTADLEQIQE